MIAAMSVPEEQIAALGHETLLVHGRDDQVIPPATSHRLRDLIPNSQLHIFARFGHWVQIEHANRFNTLLDSFLTGAL
jgi:pimeloyl-ACP methyl ester carboxylesterase